MKLTGLIVEDNEDIALITSYILANHEIEVEALQDGKAALRWLAENKPTLVLLDLQLPGASGLDILDYIKQSDRLTQTTVIIFTANDNMATIAERKGADLVLCKPTNFEIIDKHIANILDQKDP